MPAAVRSGTSYMRKLFLFNHGVGLLIGCIFPFFAYLMLGEVALILPFFLSCALFGFALGAAAYWFVRQTLRNQLQEQLAALQMLAGEDAEFGASQSVEALYEAVHHTVAEVQSLLTSLRTTVDEFVPHYQALADAGRYLSARAEDGLQAARQARSDVDGVYAKQQEVMEQVETLTGRSQDEAALSRELSASLEEMAGALEHSTQKFLETTRNVDQMVASIQNSTSQAESVAATMESTARDLDGIGEAIDTLRQGVVHSAQNAQEVEQDAEEGVQVVSSFVDEMGRIDQESQKAVTAMQRLARQTTEVTKIIEVIKEMVSDTELLAFNAAIIAAKAGAEGRGFSVVAEEIRDLADRTAGSADEIEALVKTMQKDAQQVNATVESTGRFISRGMELSQSTGEALRKIVRSSNEASQTSQDLADRTGEQSGRARGLIEEAGRNLRSVRDITRAMEQLEASVADIHGGVNEMKSAADQIARGFDEQVKANHEFDRGLSAREDQIQAIFAATRYQMDTVARIFDHFGRSEERLVKNAERARVIDQEIGALEGLAAHLHELAARFRLGDLEQQLPAAAGERQEPSPENQKKSV